MHSVAQDLVEWISEWQTPQAYIRNSTSVRESSGVCSSLRSSGAPDAVV